MRSFEINQSKRKKAIKQVVKANVKTAKGGVKFCYGLTWFLRILAVFGGLANILYVVFLSNYIVDIIRNKLYNVSQYFYSFELDKPDFFFADNVCIPDVVCSSNSK